MLLISRMFDLFEPIRTPQGHDQWSDDARTFRCIRNSRFVPRRHSIQDTRWRRRRSLARERATSMPHFSPRFPSRPQIPGFICLTNIDPVMVAIRPRISARSPPTIPLITRTSCPRVLTRKPIYSGDNIDAGAQVYHGCDSR